METNIKVITNQDCSNLNDYNFLSAFDLSKAKIRRSLPNGIPDEMLCAEGLSLNASGAFTVSPICRWQVVILCTVVKLVSYREPAKEIAEDH